MGDPKKPRKKYSTPRNPWRSGQLSLELQLAGTYGLRNKRELWKSSSILSRLRKRARSLLVAPREIRAGEEGKLLQRLYARGLVGEGATLDDVLGLMVESILGRRLQTVVWKKGLASTPHHARQLITHRHVLVRGNIVSVPSYLVSRADEDTLRIRPDSPLITVMGEKRG